MVQKTSRAHMQKGGKLKTLFYAHNFTDDTNLWNKQIDILNENFISDRQYSHK